MAAMAYTDLIDAATNVLELDAEKMGRAIGRSDLTRMQAEQHLVQSRGLGKAEAKRIVKAWVDSVPRQATSEASRPATLPAWAVVPPGWRIERRGVMRETPDGMLEVVCTVPIYIGRRLIDVETREERWILHWLDAGTPRTTEAPRVTCAASRSITELSRWGIPVTSTTASGVVDWLAAFAAASPIPVEESTARNGWHDSQSAFVVGARTVALGGRSPVRLMGDPITPSGTPEGWLSAICTAMRYPRLLVGVGASLASPLLHLWGHPGFVVSYDGRSSIGKSVAAGLAASLWGHPSPEHHTPYVRTWDMTHVGREMYAEWCGHLPIIIDETQRHTGREEALSEAVYQLAHGTGRARAKSGTEMQAQRRWQAVVISTGEQPLARTSTHGGLRARVIGMWGSPFGGSQETDVLLISECIRAHHGHAGPQWVEHIMRQGHEGIAARRQELRLAWRVHGDVGGRLAAHAATIGAALWTAVDWLGWADDGREVAQGVWEVLEPILRDADTDADPAERAWYEIQGWLAARRELFDGAPGNRQPSTGWLGRWVNGGYHLTTLACEQFCKEHGYRWAAIRAAWASDGRIVTDERGHAKRQRWNGSIVRLYEIGSCQHQDTDESE
jgi:hypothetical protein